MFEQLFERPHALARQRNGPLAEERRRYLAHCADQQMAPRTLRGIAIYTLVIARALRLADRPVTGRQAQPGPKLPKDSAISNSVAVSAMFFPSTSRAEGV